MNLNNTVISRTWDIENQLIDCEEMVKRLCSNQTTGCISGRQQRGERQNVTPRERDTPLWLQYSLCYRKDPIRIGEDKDYSWTQKNTVNILLR